MTRVLRSPRAPALALAVAVACLLGGCGGGGDGSAAIHWPKPQAGAMVVVPKVVGLTPGSAARRMRRAGLELKPGYTGSEGNPAIDSDCFVIYSQAVAAGARRPRGTVVASTQGVCHGDIVPGGSRARRHHWGQTYSAR